MPPLKVVGILRGFSAADRIAGIAAVGVAAAGKRFFDFFNQTRNFFFHAYSFAVRTNFYYTKAEFRTIICCAAPSDNDF